MSTLWQWCVMVAVLTLTSLSVQGQSGDFPLLVEVSPSSKTTRTGGPTPLTLNASWHGPGVLHGDLIVEIHAGREFLGTFIQRDLYIMESSEIDFLVPPLADEFATGFMDVSLWFERDGKRYRLANQQLWMSAMDGRKLVLTTAVPEVDLENDADPLATGMEFDIFQPLDRGESRRSANITLVNKIAAERLPTRALDHCVRDILVLNSEGFALLNQQQLESLLAWVRAGGSVFIQLDQTAQPGQQVDFLNQLTMTGAAEPVFLPSRLNGPRLANVQVAQGPVLHRCGLGRVAIDPSEYDLTADDLERRVAPFLWKMRRDQAAEIAQTGSWSWNTAWRTSHYHAQGTPLDWNVENAMRNLRPVPVTSGLGLIRHLLPQGFELVPLWLIAVVLIAFIAVVGPLDYFWLGFLTSRKWTWISFPLMSIAFTWLAIAVSNAYMNTGEQVNHIVIRDIVEGGHIARENELQLLFSNVMQVVETEVESAIFTPLVYQRFTGLSEFSFQQTEPDINRGGPVGRPVFEGPMPEFTVVKQALPQWTPQLNRMLRISDKPLQETSGFDWDVPVIWSETTELRHRIRTTFGADATAHLYRRPNRTNPYLVVDQQVLQGTANIISNNEPTLQEIPLGGGVWFHDETGPEFVQQISATEARGIFSVVAQLAPSGGDQFEDLSLLDPSAPDDILLVIAVPEPDGLLTIYRRLYATAPEQQ